MEKYKKVAIIVAHPDDETLWAGGTILNHPEWECFIVTLCRKSDPDRAPKFHRVLKEFNANGDMGDLDDGAEQIPLAARQVQLELLQLLPATDFNLILTHNPHGEYTTHIRHQEVSQAVINLWYNSAIVTAELWVFAYEDQNRHYFPKTVPAADLHFSLALKIWKHKYDIITKLYGFNKDSWEAQTTPKEEAFWQFSDPKIAFKWLKDQQKL
ncbi:PIG-L family deacetylase [Mucilaginibacter antarcticus]|uniref:PIG-L family deacetylase n=1 Tax=Mucilaginibacter antarcticus TaxID=1855725 RepID=A0ABW5XR67_9SPHI